jgi:transcriptional regulator with XRE-family HTH domain
MEPLRFTEALPDTLPSIAGKRLRDLRDRLGLTLRAVEEASVLLAEAYQNPEFLMPPSRLSDIETKGVVPSIYRMHTLALVYRISREEILAWYGIPAASIAPVPIPHAPNTHVIAHPEARKERIHLPYRLDPAFDERKTVDFGRFVQQWGSVPMRFVEEMANGDFVYGYVGTEDLTMYPILPPGSFVQVDPSKNRVRKGVWRSDYDRPIYFLETRESYVCAWCLVRDGKIIVQPHPMSPCEVRIMRYPQEAEVIGQVVGAAIRLGELLRLPGASPLE